MEKKDKYADSERELEEGLAELASSVARVLGEEAEDKEAAELPVEEKDRGVFRREAPEMEMETAGAPEKGGTDENKRNESDHRKDDKEEADDTASSDPDRERALRSEEVLGEEDSPEDTREDLFEGSEDEEDLPGQEEPGERGIGLPNPLTLAADRLRSFVERQARETFEGDEEEGRKKWTRLHTLMVYGGVAAGVLLAVILLFAVVRFWKFSGYHVIMTKNQEDTLSVNYASVNRQVLRYGRESAVYYDLKGRQLWEVKYTMNQPELVVRGNTAAIYDRDGTSVMVVNKKGKLGAFTTEYPIIKADVAADGQVAAIQEEAGTTWIQYYAADGDKIASMRTTIDSPGYPLALSLSENGLLLAVSYLSFEGDQQSCKVNFYSFGSIGKNRMDNKVSEYTYGDELVPQLEYIGNSTCVGYTTNGFQIYGGSRIPDEARRVTVEGEIVSVIGDDSHIGLIVTDPADAGLLRLMVFEPDGSRILDREIDFAYDSAELVGNEVDFYNGAQICVYNLSGVKKYEGEYKGAVKEICSLGEHRFLVAEEDKVQAIRLG